MAQIVAGTPSRDRKRPASEPRELQRRSAARAYNLRPRRCRRLPQLVFGETEVSTGPIASAAVCRARLANRDLPIDCIASRSHRLPHRKGTLVSRPDSVCSLWFPSLLLALGTPQSGSRDLVISHEADRCSHCSTSEIIIPCC